MLEALTVRRGRAVAPDQVADTILGGVLPSTWSKQVQICIARLRKVLGATAIETGAGGYRLVVRGDEVDIDRFERLVDEGRAFAATGRPARGRHPCDRFGAVARPPVR